MIIGNRFEGDNLVVAKYQHDVYGDALGIIFSKTSNFYINHANAIQLRDEITYFLFRIKRFDHRPFQLFHDLIAGYYRYKNCAQFKLPFKEFSPSPKTEEEWQEHWLEYLNKEMDRLLDFEFCIDLVHLFLLYHTDYGYTLENRLALALTDLYFSESEYRYGKGVNLLGKYYDGFKEEIKDEPDLNGKEILKLVQENRELIEERIK